MGEGGGGGRGCSEWCPSLPQPPSWFKMNQLDGWPPLLVCVFIRSSSSCGGVQHYAAGEVADGTAAGNEMINLRHRRRDTKPVQILWSWVQLLWPKSRKRAKHSSLVTKPKNSHTNLVVCKKTHPSSTKSNSTTMKNFHMTLDTIFQLSCDFWQ